MIGSRSGYEVPEPIINSPFEEPKFHWNIIEGETPQKLSGRRKAFYFYRDPRSIAGTEEVGNTGIAIELRTVNRIRERLAAWRIAGYPGATRITLELLAWWSREGRKFPLFFAQRESAETIIFLREARSDFLQGIDLPRDEPGEEKRKSGFEGFLRYACKMATGSGKTMVMGMLAAWSILNKVHNRSDKRFSDLVLVVCPNVTIRDRLRELDTREGEASIYFKRDIVSAHLLPALARGRVVVTNWHVFEPRESSAGGIRARVIKTGQPDVRIETITIGEKNTTARGRRYLTRKDLDQQIAAGILLVRKEVRNKSGEIIKVEVERTRYIQSDTALVAKVLGKEGKDNILVMNDEAHHAYRIRRDDDETDDDLFGEDEEKEEFYREATIWIDGLDRVQKLRGINFCVDLSATPYFLGRVGQDANRPFPWVVSDFGLIEAIESGLVKIPQLAVRDSTGDRIPGYFNIWKWILEKCLTPAERGGQRASPKPEAILKYAHHPIAMLGGLWAKEFEAKQDSDDHRPPVSIIVCKNTQIAKMLYEWIAENRAPAGIPVSKLGYFRNTPGTTNTIRVDCKVVNETDTGESKSDEARWMRFTLDTVGKLDWPRSSHGIQLYPTGFKELAEKMERPTHPPGRDVRCIISVGMLTEGWDCNTVTHIVGLRPFMSQLLCEQVVGRALRRTSYAIGEDGKFSEEIAQIFGVPFEVIPLKASSKEPPSPIKRHHVHALPEKSCFEINFPRVDGYTCVIRNRISVAWDRIPTLAIDPARIPPEVEMKAMTSANMGRPALHGPGKTTRIDLEAARSTLRLQEVIFDIAGALTREIAGSPECAIPAHALFPQIRKITEHYVENKIDVVEPGNRKDIHFAPYYGWCIETLRASIGPDVGEAELPEIPRYEAHRGEGSTSDVEFWTSRDVREATRSHLNYVVADTKVWEQSAAYAIDVHDITDAFVKNAGLGFAIPYFHNGAMHEYVPDFILRLKTGTHVILETKGYDPLTEVKRDAALRWVMAVNADERHGRWEYFLAKNPGDVRMFLDDAAKLSKIKDANARLVVI